MKRLTEDQYIHLVNKTTILADENCKNTIVIQNNLHRLLENSPGEALKDKKKHLRAQFKSNGVSYSYLCKLISTAALEIELSLNSGTLVEYHSRLLLEEKNPFHRKLIYKKAVELAGADSLKSTHIVQAIDQMAVSNGFTEGKSSSTNAKPTKSKQTITKDTTVDVVSKKCDLDVDYVPPVYVEDTAKELVTAQDIYHDIKENIKSRADRILLIKVINTSNNFWNIFKKLIKLRLTESDAKELVDLIDPNGELQASISAKEGNLAFKRPKNHERKARVKQHRRKSPF